MSDVVVQATFNSGEWSPKLFARVDLAKYKSGAALLENFFIDYRGGVSSRPGTKYIIQAYKSATPVRLINFQASSNIGYILEFGDGYVRFIYNGAPVIEAPFNITNATNASSCVLTIPGHNYTVQDWIFVTGVNGMTQLNDRYFSIINVAGSNITLGDLNNVPVNSTSYGAYTSGGTSARIYTISSPYTSADNLRLIKFAQSVNQMTLCHPNHPVYNLTLISATNWTLSPAVIGASIGPPTTGFTIASTLGFTGATNYAYVVTSIDGFGQESTQSAPFIIASGDLRVTAGSITLGWDPVAGAVAYNIYKSIVNYYAVVPTGISYGFIGSTKSTTFVDSNINADFSQTPPISQNPFVGSGIDFITVTNPGVYTSVPTISFTGFPSVPASATARLGLVSIPTITSGGSGFVVGDSISFGNNVILNVEAESAGAITAWSIAQPGSITAGTTPANPVAQIATSGSGTGATATMTWGVIAVIVTGAGAGYVIAPAVIFSSGAAVAGAVLAPASSGNPTVPGFVQQRLFLGGASGAPQTFHMSKPGIYYNFDTSSPIKADDAVTGTLVSTVLSEIKSVLGAPSGMLILTNRAAWLVNGGSPGSAITPMSIVANLQSYVGASDVPPILANYDVLFVQDKGYAIRDLAFNIYFNTFTGADISTLSSHLFYGYTIEEWAWAEQPYYLVQAIRNDGVMLSLTYLKEQDFIGWTHFITQGNFKSVATSTEKTSTSGTVDAVYVSVARVVGGRTLQYIERFVERTYPNGKIDAWCVDSALGYSGPPLSTFSGAEHLAGLTVTGLADGEVITPFVMPADGRFVLPAPASKVVVGLGFTCQLQTLAIDVGEPSIQGKVKKINDVNVRVAETLGLQIGVDFNHLVDMKDLVVGNVSSTLTGQQAQVITDLVSGDAMTYLSPAFTVPGQYCIQQSLPYPASILGVFPTLTLGDTK